MKRVLIITYYWPPSGGSGVQRWLKLSKYLLRFGWQPVIYTPSNPEANSVDESLLKDIAPEVEVLKRRITEPYALYKLLSGKKKTSRIKANAIESSNSKGVASFIRGNLFIPDPRCWWIKPSVRFLKKWLSENKVDAIISTGPPHSMHLIARELHRKTGIPWIADFRDPWTRLFYFKHLNLTNWAKKKHRALELSVLSDASKVTVVTFKMQVDYMRDLKNICGIVNAVCKVECIENGYDPADFDNNTNSALKEEVERIAEITKGKFVVGHTGLLTDSANPPEFWKALGELAAENKEFADKLQIVVAGQTDAQAKECFKQNGLDKYVIDLGYVPHPRAIALQKRADILLLPLRKEPEAAGILTGKLFEYLASASPIIAFGSKRCELEKILKETGAGVLFEYEDSTRGAKDTENAKWGEYAPPIEKKTVKDRIKDIWYIYYKNGSHFDKATNISKYSRITQAEAFARLLNEISE